MQDTVVKRGTGRCRQKNLEIQTNKIPGARSDARDVAVAHPFALSSREIMSL
jgi:hypothetical protein